MFNKNKKLKLSVSDSSNPNYLAKIVSLSGLKKHVNADKLQQVVIDFQSVIVGSEMKDGDICVYFPVESEINKEFLSHTNSFRDKEINHDKDKAGFFEKNCRVRAVKLRGEYSLGYLVPISHVQEFIGSDFEFSIGDEFDMIGDILMCKKYVVPVKESSQQSIGKKPRISRLVDGQVHLHVDTENLRHNAYAISPDDVISVTYKTHGTSWWVSNVLVKRKISIFEKLISMFGVKIQETEYDYVYGSRKVVKNEYETQGVNNFYDTDIWSEVKDAVKDFIPKGFTLYGECLGYTSLGSAIQGEYDYGCVSPSKRIQVYRITVTNEDGTVINLSSTQTKEYCDRFGLEYVHPFYFGKAKDLFPELDTNNHWNEEFVKNLEEKYNEKDCFMCKNSVPEEGVVIRKDSLFNFESYKLKSFRFLEMETEMLDKEIIDIESEN
jgi:ribosomal protein S4